MHDPSVVRLRPLIFRHLLRNAMPLLIPLAIFAGGQAFLACVDAVRAAHDGLMRLHRTAPWILAAQPPIFPPAPPDRQAPHPYAGFIAVRDGVCWIKRWSPELKAWIVYDLIEGEPACLRIHRRIPFLFDSPVPWPRGSP